MNQQLPINVENFCRVFDMDEQLPINLENFCRVFDHFLRTLLASVQP
jgi:hypothetical protein